MRARRCAENQSRFHDANNRLRDLVQERTAPEQRIPFLCECGDDACLGRVELDLTEYEQLHKHAGVFVIVPGHPRVQGEIVLRREVRFEQVEKHNPT